VLFQKITIPPPKRVIGNSEWEGSRKRPKLEFPEGWGGEVSNQKKLCGGVPYLLD